MNPLPGFRDFYPDPPPRPDASRINVRNHIFGKWRDAARRYGFYEYDGPPLEPLELYKKKSGEEIVAQLFNFVDKGDREVALRPEMTPTLARMIVASQRNYKKPIKWFAIPQLFRYERQQRGRLREHFQFNADIIGEEDVTADAELIALAIESLRSLGLTEDDFLVRVSDREAWKQKFFDLGLSEHEKQHAAFQAIDKLEREPQKTREKLAALSLTEKQIEGVLGFARAVEESSIHPGMASIQQVFNLLGSELAKFCRADFRIVRGLTYYTGIVWEIHDRKGEFRAIAGGGRYDDLILLMSDAKLRLPAAGFGMGDVVLTELLKARGLLTDAALGPKLDCYVAIIGGKAQKGNLEMEGSESTWRDQALLYIHEWRHKGLAIDYDLAGGNISKHMQIAQEKGARFFLVFGPDEWSKGEVAVKDMLTGRGPEGVKVTEIVDRLMDNGGST